MSKRGGVYALGKGGEEGTRLEIWMSNVSGDWGWKRKTHRKRRALWALFGKTRSAQRTGGILQIKILGNMRLLLLSAQIALHDAGGELVAAGVEGHALGQTCQLIDEAHPFHPPIVFDQRERADAAPFADCQYRLLERRDRAALIGRIEEVDEVAFDVGRGLAVGDDEELLVFAGALAEDAAGELQAQVQGGEVLRGAVDLVDR